MNDEPPDLNDLETLKHLCRVRDNAWCERPFDSYINRLFGRQERGEPLTELQLLILDAFNLRRCHEESRHLVDSMRKHLTDTTKQPHKLHRLDWELIDGEWTHVTKAEIYGWCSVNTETGEVELDDFNQFDDNLKELLDGWTWQRFTLTPSTNTPETTCTESP